VRRSDLSDGAVGSRSSRRQARLLGPVASALQSVDGEESAEVAGVVTEVVRPRICSSPDSPSSLGREAVEFARRVGLTLDPEQELALEVSLGVRADGRWSSFEVGVNMPRQNGKGEILLARELFGLFELGETFIVHSAHEFKTSELHFRRMEGAVRESEELLARVKRSGSGRVIGFRYSHGDEAIELEDGARIEFRTRTRSGMRGFADVSVLVLDEAMIISQSAHGSMIPTLRASKAKRGPQLWYAGSAVDQEVHDHGVVWTRVRDRGIAADSDLTYLEWSLDFEHPDEVPDEVASDPVEWRKVNFAIGRGRVLEEHMAREYRALSPREFATELLGVGDYPVTDGSAGMVISAQAWADLEDDGSELLDPVCIAFDVSPSRKTSIAAAGMTGSGKLHVEVINARAGTGWVADRLAELYERHEVEEIVCDGFGPSVAIARRVDDAVVTVRRVHAGEYAEACGVFEDLVGERQLRHIGQDELTAAIRGARTRPLVDRWAWSRTKSVADVGPLIAATLATWSASQHDLGELAIY
jgi:hypothetical protein